VGKRKTLFLLWVVYIVEDEKNGASEEIGAYSFDSCSGCVRIRVGVVGEIEILKIA
jgi:hypothetical protein